MRTSSEIFGRNGGDFRRQVVNSTPGITQVHSKKTYALLTSMGPEGGDRNNGSLGVTHRLRAA